MKLARGRKPCTVCGGARANFRVTGGAGDQHKLRYWLEILTPVNVEWDDKLCDKCQCLLKRVNILACKVQGRFRENNKAVPATTGSSSKADHDYPVNSVEGTVPLDFVAETSQLDLSASQAASTDVSQPNPPAQSDDDVPSSRQADSPDSTHRTLFPHPQSVPSKSVTVVKSEIKSSARSVDGFSAKPQVVKSQSRPSTRRKGIKQTVTLIGPATSDVTSRTTSANAPTQPKAASNKTLYICMPKPRIRNVGEGPADDDKRGGKRGRKSSGSSPPLIRRGVQPLEISGSQQPIDAEMTDIGGPAHTFDLEIKQEVTDSEGEGATGLSPIATCTAVKLGGTNGTQASQAVMSSQSSESTDTSSTVGDVSEGAAASSGTTQPPGHEEMSASGPSPLAPDPLITPTPAAPSPNQEKREEKLQLGKSSKGLKRRRKKGKPKFKMPYDCERCKVKFLFEESLKNHQQRPMPCQFRPGKSEEEKIERSKAWKRDAYYKMKARGLAKRAKGEDAFLCDLCGKGFYMKQYLVRHMDTHQDSRPYECDKCPFRGKSSWALGAHNRKKHADTSLLCTECGKWLPNPEIFKAHMKRHSNPYNCSECDGKFADFADKLEHMKNVHGKLTPGVTEMRLKGQFKCQVCEALLPTRRAFRYHATLHTEAERLGAAEGRSADLTAKCRVCEAEFSSEASLRYHATFHSEEEWRSVGEDKAPGPVSAEDDEGPVITGDEDEREVAIYSCAYCSFVAESRHGLSEHLETHDDDKSFGCRLCKAVFQDRTDLTRHLVTEH